MKRIHLVVHLSILSLMALLFVGSRCLPKDSYHVNGTLFGRPYSTTVDHPLAKEMLTHPGSLEVGQLLGKFSGQPLETETLREVANSYSMDVSTLYFLARTYSMEENRRAQDSYLRYVDELSESNYDEMLEPLRDYYVVFAPGLDYHDTTNGGDFAKQRRLLTRHGVGNELIPTGTWGYTEDNAAIIAKRLKELNQEHKQMVVVSASKGGLDVAVALGGLVSAEEVSSVKAWISVGGILRGSPVADEYLRFPKRWIAKVGLLFVGQKLQLVRDVSYHSRKRKFEELDFPSHIKRIHFVGAPLSTQIHKRIKANYCSIKDYGPNDGITPLADEVTEGGIVVSELGFDHYYKHPEIDKRTIALALTVLEM